MENNKYASNISFSFNAVRALERKWRSLRYCFTRAESLGRKYKHAELLQFLKNDVEGGDDDSEEMGPQRKKKKEQESDYDQLFLNSLHGEFKRVHSGTCCFHKLKVTDYTYNVNFNRSPRTENWNYA